MLLNQLRGFSHSLIPVALLASKKAWEGGWVVPAPSGGWVVPAPSWFFFRQSYLSVVGDILWIMEESADSRPLICQWCLG